MSYRLTRRRVVVGLLATAPAQPRTRLARAELALAQALSDAKRSPERVRVLATDAHQAFEASCPRFASEAGAARALGR